MHAMTPVGTLNESIAASMMLTNEINCHPCIQNHQFKASIGVAIPAAGKSTAFHNAHRRIDRTQPSRRHQFLRIYKEAREEMGPEKVCCTLAARHACHHFYPIQPPPGPDLRAILIVRQRIVENQCVPFFSAHPHAYTLGPSICYKGIQGVPQMHC